LEGDGAFFPASLDAASVETAAMPSMVWDPPAGFGERGLDAAGAAPPLTLAMGIDFFSPGGLIDAYAAVCGLGSADFTPNF
jgi:hypothetical protein